MSDGVVEHTEMSNALAVTGECLADLGHSGSAVAIDPQRGFAGGWTFDIEDSAAARDALRACRAGTVAELELAYLTAHVPSDAERATREDKLRECLAGLGYPVAQTELGELFTTVDPNDLVACDPATTSAASTP